MTQAPSLLAEQVRAARALFDDASRASVHVSPAEELGARLVAIEAQPDGQSLAAWVRDFRVGLHEIVDLAASLEMELEGKAEAAVFDLGNALVMRHCLPDAEVGALATQLGTNPTAEQLRAVLQTWMACAVPGSGRITAWMRGLHDRLALLSAAPPPGAAASDEEGEQPQ
jgi:hypothetical protein